MSALVATRAPFGKFAALLVISALSAWPTVSFAASAGPFRPFLGNWQGSGSITSSDDRREPITCRATYQNGDDDSSLTQSLVCASDSFRLNIETNATAADGQLQGQWQETTRGVQGQLSGQIGRGDFEGTVTGAGFTAQISIRAAGKRQEVHIQPSAGDIRSVDISLSKRK